MIRLPDNVHQIRSENITLRFVTTQECGYVMLADAGAAFLAHKMIALDSEAEYAQAERDEFDAPARPMAAIEADKARALEAFNATRYTDGQGQFCLILTVGEAMRLVAPIEQIKKMSGMGVTVTGHNFTPAQVSASATEILERFERSIAQVAEAANTQDLNNQDFGMFLPAPGAN